jgi:Protein of unknown function (DUF2917)
MRGLFTNKALTIEPGQAVSGIAQRPQTFRIVDGDVWITVEGVKHDYWLSAGDTFTAAPGKLVVVEAGHGVSRIAAPAASPHRWLNDITAFVVARLSSSTRGKTVQTSFKRHNLSNECC